MANVLIPLIVHQDGPTENLGLPNRTLKQIYVPSDSIAEMIDISETDYGTKLVIDESSVPKDVYVMESPNEVKASEDPATTNLHVLQSIDLGVPAAGSTQGAATAITKYLTEVTTVVDSSADGMVLPEAVVGAIHVVINNDSADDIDVFPAVGDFINALSVNIPFNMLQQTKTTFVCQVVDNWISIAP